MSEQFAGLASARRERISRALRGLSEVDERAVASRLALRAFPLLSRLSAPAASEDERQFISTFLRCADSAWVSAFAAVDQHIASRAADRLSTLAGSVPDRVAGDAGGAAYYSSRPIGDDEAAPLFRAIEYFGHALSRRRRASHEEQMFAVAVEVERDLEKAAGGERLLNLPLWNSGAPPWASRGWAQMKRALLRRRENWRVWTDWYDSRLSGSSFLEEAEIRRLVLADELALAPTDEANAQIAEMFGYGPEDEIDQVQDFPDPIPIPGPYAVRWEGGRLEAKPSLGAPNDREFSEDILDGIRDLAQRLRKSLAENLADEGLESSLNVLLQDLSARANEIRIGRLQIDVRTFQALASSYAQSDRESDLTLSGLLKGLAESLSDFAAQFPAIREMEAGRVALHVVAQEDISDILAPVRDIEEIAETSSAVGDSVVAALREGDAEVAALTERIDDVRLGPATKAGAIEARGRIVGQKLLTVWNLGAEAVRWSKVGAGLSAAARAAGEGTVEGIRKGVEKTVSGTISTAAAALAVHLGHPMLALSLIVQSFAPLAKKASEAGEEGED